MLLVRLAFTFVWIYIILKKLPNKTNFPVKVFIRRLLIHFKLFALFFALSQIKLFTLPDSSNVKTTQGNVDR